MRSKRRLGSSISAIAVAPGNSDLCWVGHNNGDIYKTMDCTAASPTWTQVDNNSPGLPDRMVMRLTIDPSDPSGNRVYATFGGFSAENVWRTADGGASWSSAAAAALAAFPPCRCTTSRSPGQLELAVRGHRDRRLHQQDAGVTWQVPQDGPANVIVSELFWMGSDLVAATFGRGLFKATVVTGGRMPACPEQDCRSAIRRWARRALHSRDVEQYGDCAAEHPRRWRGSVDEL